MTPDSADEADGIGPADYTWSCEAAAPNASALTAEQWLRATWQDDSPWLGRVLYIAWKFGLGLRLAAANSPAHVVGWVIDDNDPATIDVSTTSRAMTATNSVSVHDESIRWTTQVHFRNIVGRVVWMPARVVHQWLVTRRLRHAISLRA